ncbi:hypothetical protein [Rhodoferax sp.]|uniref:hypothetical protein n=1 Tax=Rhodoferax sp. TaxID=50421 RepID=UPI001EC856D5|nr:hypothetical protein [Rhodoferax sp.]MBT9505034.1 hypothetical protein [Rhodoferax sp.]
MAALISVGIAYWSTSLPFAHNLIRIQAEKKLAAIDKRIVDAPLETQALLLDYAGDEDIDAKSPRGELVLKAWIAFSKYPEQSPEVFRLYGSDPAFQKILRAYGEVVVPIIKYFLDNDVTSVHVRESAGNALQATKQVVQSAKNALMNLIGTGQGNPQPQPQPPKQPLGPTERGSYAIGFIGAEGHKLLGQFVLDSKGQVQWNTTDRVVGGLVNFLVGGVSNLESKYRRDEELEKSDYFFAALDVVPFVASVKLLKMGKMAATSEKELSLVSKTRLYGARLIPKSEALQKLGKYGVIAATGYVIVTHPSLLNSVFSGIAEMLVLNPMLVKFIGWFALISVALYPFMGALKLIVRLLLSFFSWLQSSLGVQRCNMQAS